MKHTLSLMEIQPFPYMSHLKPTITRALSKMVPGFRAMRSMKNHRSQEHTLLLHATLVMIQATVKPLEAEFQLALSMAIQLQWQILKKSSGMKLELHGHKNTLWNFNGNSLTTNMQLHQVWKVFIAQTQEMEQNRPKRAPLLSQCGQ